MTGPAHVDAARVGTVLSWRDAIEALRGALAAGLDPQAEPLRGVTAFGAGQLLTMPPRSAPYAGVKLATVAPGNAGLGLPRVHAVYVLFDAVTLAPVATLDGTALTSVRTPAVAALGVDLVAPALTPRLVVFGTGPQAWGHVAALATVRRITSVGVVGRDPARTAAFVARLRADGVRADVVTATAVATADIVACCTSSDVPVFDGRELPAHTVVVTSGAHEAHTREVDVLTVQRCGGAAVESRVVAAAEAGDLIAAGDVPLVTFAELVTGTATSVPRLVKTVGTGWEDLAVATAIVRGPPG